MTAIYEIMMILVFVFSKASGASTSSSILLALAWPAFVIYCITILYNKSKIEPEK